MVQVISQRLRIWVKVFVETHGVPPVLTPVLPVLDYHTKRDALALKAVGSLQYLVGRMETFAAVDIAQCPRRNLRTGTCQFAVGGDHIVGGTDENGIIDLGGYR